MYVKCDTVNNQIRTTLLMKKWPIRHLKHHYSEDNRNNNLHHLSIPTILNYHQRTQTARQHRGFVNLRLHLRNPTEKTETQGSKRFAVFPLLEEHLFSSFSKYSMSFGNQILEKFTRTSFSGKESNANKVRQLTPQHCVKEFQSYQINVESGS